MEDMNTLLGDLHAERRQRQGLPVPPVEAPAPVEPPAPVVQADADDAATADDSVRDPDEVIVEQLVDDAELVAVPLLRADQAEPRYIEAVQTAVAACADTEGQACYICTEAVKEGTNEGLVSGFCACRGDLSFAHVSCLARGAQVEVERDAQNGWKRWNTCRQCEQEYHGVVRCALGWACWKTYVGWPETDWPRRYAMGELGSGLSAAGHHEDALAVGEAELSMMRRVGVPEEYMLVAQGNLASTYGDLGREEEALFMGREVYSGHLKLNGEEYEHTLAAACNYASSLLDLQCFEEAKALLRRTIPVARRILGENDEITLTMRRVYAKALYVDPSATLDDLREAVTTLEDTERTARRVFGGAHPLTADIEDNLRDARAELRASETPSPAHSGRPKPSSDDAAELTEAEVRGALQAAGGRMKTKDLLVRFKARLKANPANKDAIKRILRAVADVQDSSGVRVLVLKAE